MNSARSAGRLRHYDWQMLRAIGGFLDRVWPHILAVGGAVALALSPLYLDWLRTQGAHAGRGDAFAIVAVVGAALASVAGIVYGAWRYERARVRVQAELMTAVRSSLMPAAEHFVRLPRPVNDATFEDAITDLTARCQLFAKKDNDSPDANVYKLDRSRLVRVNRASGSARLSFETAARGRSEDLVSEDKQVIERVRSGEVAICTDVKSRRVRKKLGLAAVERSYRSFISVPILRPDGSVYGMISLNSRRRNGLGDLHLTFLVNIALLIAALDSV